MYDIFYIGDQKLENFPTAQRVDSFEHAQQMAMTKMFWLVWSDLNVNFDFTYIADKWSLDVTHVFKNKDHYDGICLFPKEVKITQEEINTRSFFNNKKVDIQASSPKQYDRFFIKDYADYLDAIDNTSTDMFWAVWPEIEVTNTAIFDKYFSHHDVYNRSENHAWQHQFRKDEITFGGLHLMCKNKPVSKKEIDFRFLIRKKEHKEIASQHSMYDIVFISYNEPNADENYFALKERFPCAKRIHGVKGIHQAHIAAAKLCDTEMFWIVDGDAIVCDDFDFSHVVNRYELSTVHVWRSQNPVNDMVYGYGGIKLFPTQLTIDMDTSKPDMTTSISDKFKAVQEISNITAFNTGPFETWKSAFRECCKLSSKVIDRQKDTETNTRLHTWCTVGEDKKYGKYAISGAKLGAAYGAKNQGNLTALKKINDFDWLQEQFENANI